MREECWGVKGGGRLSGRGRMEGDREREGRLGLGDERVREADVLDVETFL